MSTVLETIDPAGNGRTGSSAERSLRLLALLAGEGRPLSLAELANRLDLPKATTHRLCGQLLMTGFIVRAVDEREYTVGPAMRELALDTLNHGSAHGLRHQVLVELVDEVGETCNFTTLDGAVVRYLDRVEAHRPWRLTLNIGAEVPLHCTASGKLFLSQLTAERRRQLLEHLTLKPMTDQTLTSVAALEEECARIAVAGHSFDREEFVSGLVAIAVPVRDQNGETRAAVSLHGPTTHISLQEAESKLPALQAAAKRMAALLSF